MRRWMRIPGLALLVLVLLAFPYGPLFPWSPVKPGYEKTELTRADVYSSKGKPLDPAFRRVDEFIVQTEKLHQLAMPKRITVIACANWSDFKRFMPTLGAVGGATLATGTALYITPKIAENNFDTSEFLLHELSHACLYQHTSIWNSQKMNQAAWLLEGLAVLNGRQKAYISAAEFKERAKVTDLTRVIGPGLNDLPQPVDMRFNYVAWRYFLEHLQSSRGRDRFQELLVAFLDDAGAVHSAFQRIYGMSVNDAVREFQQELRLGVWTPR
ncbi:MAG TPA: hypothetical protein VGP79_00255 [Bryobacteraceae bacterium]|jgi:hypothetical protein|nr:hypothetical protein [Bryobacteraceae bacterium]